MCVSADCPSAEDLSFLLDSKASAQQQQFVSDRASHTKGRSCSRVCCFGQLCASFVCLTSFCVCPLVSVGDTTLFNLDSYQECNWWTSYPHGESVCVCVM